jgi:hypothetical protein
LRESPNAVAVPVRALIPDGDTPHIYLVSDGRARRWLVSPGVQQDGWVAVTPPPAVGARVAVSNLEALVDGAVVYAVIDTEVRP